MKKIWPMLLTGTLLISWVQAQQGRVQISERWDDRKWSRVIVKLKDGSEVSYDRSQLWGLFYDYGSVQSGNPPPRPPAAQTQTWQISILGSPGTLWLTGQKIVLRFDKEGDESLSEVQLGNGQIRFVRPIPEWGQGYQQVYTGRFVDAHNVVGEFTCPINGRGGWSMKRVR
jgi:hypothetical protein